jgi:hypothetical protein
MQYGPDLPIHEDDKLGYRTYFSYCRLIYDSPHSQYDCGWEINIHGLTIGQENSCFIHHRYQNTF